MTGAAVQAQVIGGKVTREFKMNGAADAAVSVTFSDQAGNNDTPITTRFAEPALAGTQVTIYGDNPGAPLGSVITNASGIWSFTVPGTYTGTHVVIEFTPPASKSFLTSGPIGTANKSSVVRVAKNVGTNINFTMGLGTEHAQDNPTLALTCFALPNPSTADGNPGSTEPMVISFPYNGGGPFTGATDAGTGTGVNYYGAGTYPPITTKKVLTTFNNTGSVYGLSYDKRRNRLFTSAFERAYTGLGPNGSGGEAKIYSIVLDGSGNAAGTSVWLDLEAALSSGVAGTDPAITAGISFVSGVPRTLSYFEHNKIGHIGLGDLELSVDGKMVFVTNLFDKTIYGIPIKSDGTADTGNIKTFTIPNPCGAGSFNDPASPAGTRPYNAVLGLGVHPENGKVYCTVTCTGAAAADLKGYVYSFDPTQASPTFTQELTIPLNFTFKGGDGTQGIYIDYPNIPWAPVANNADVTDIYDSHAWLADVVFDIDPSGEVFMIVGGRNRFMDATSGSRITVAQGVWLAAPNGAGWTLESNGVAGTRTTANNLSLSWFTIRNGNGVFFNTNGSEGANGTGNLVAIPGFTELAMAAVDNIRSAGNSGISFMKRNDGSRTRDQLLLGSLTEGGVAPRASVYKANLWGETEALIEPAPIEIGNYVFKDNNNNNVQDGADTPLQGVTVTLIEDLNQDGNPTEPVISTKTTDPDGYYVFTKADGIKYDTKYIVVINNAGDFSSGPLVNLTPVLANQGGSETLDSDGDILSGNTVKAVVVTGGPGDIQHQIDFGFSVSCSTITNPSAAQTQCLGSTGTNVTVNTNQNTANSIKFVKFNSDQMAGATPTALEAAAIYAGTGIGSTVTPVGASSPYTATYIWNSADFSAPGTYYVYAILNPDPGAACRPVQEIQVTIVAKPNAGQNQTVCAGTSATLTGTSPTTGTWTAQASPANPAGATLGTTTAGIATVSFASTASGIFKFVYTANNCTDTVQVTVNAKPNAGTDIIGGSAICNTVATVNLPDAANGESWTQLGTAPKAVTINATTGVVTGMDAVGTYQFILRNTITSCADTVSVEVKNCNLGSIGDFVWKDLNDNGIQDLPTEKGVKGIIVQLLNSGTNAVLATDTTDANGIYGFPNLASGTYKVKIVLISLPDTCRISPNRDVATGGGNDTNDSDFNPTTGESPVITINTSGTGVQKDNPTIDAALIKLCIKPAWQITSAPVCSPAAAVYSVSFSVANKNGTLKVNKGTLTGSNPYTVSNIPNGTNLIITDSLSALCKYDTTIVAPDCSCPQITLLTPNATACKNDTLPTLKIFLTGNTTGVGVNWYAGSTGGAVLATGLTFKPAGTISVNTTYYVELTGTSGTCVGQPRTPVTVTALDCKVDLALKKSISTKIAQIGDVLTFTIKVWNESTANASGVEVTDSIATSVLFQTGSFVASRGSASIANSVIKWTIGSIAANGDTVTLSYQVKAIQEGIHFNTAEISKMNEQDIDSTPGNGTDGEDDIARQCFSVPLKLCTAEKIEASIPAKYLNVQWFKDGSSTAVATGNTVIFSETGIYTFTATNNTCPAGGCCPIIIEMADSCCPVNLCVPFTMKQTKKAGKPI